MQLNKDGTFYPIGRLVSIASINILCEEDGIWTSLKEMVLFGVSQDNMDQAI